MKRLITTVLSIIALLFYVYPAIAVTNTRTAGGTLWSETTYWDQGHVPAADEIVDLGAQVVNIDAGTTRIPASGNLASISASGAGQIVINMTTVGNALEIHCGTGNITCGTVATGFLLLSGATNPLTITGNIVGAGQACIVSTFTGLTTINGFVQGGTNGNGITNSSTGTITINNGTNNAVIGGSANGGVGISNVSTGTINITGNAVGGSGDSNANAITNTGAASINIIGDVQGGTGSVSVGINNKATGTITVTGNLINGTKGVAISGYPPVWSPASNNYTKWGTYYMAPQKTAPELKKGIVNGTITGTYDGGGYGLTP
jgi:hypothetical protein